MRFDWYAATVRDDRYGGPKGSVLVQELAERMGAATVTEKPGLYGYALQHRGETLGGDVLFNVLEGGTQPWPSAWASGDATDAFVPVVRTFQHRVTRMDAAQDYQAPGAWDQLYPLVLDHADQHQLKISQAGDWHRGIEGRTLYVGSRKSPVFLRLYEKGKEQRAKAPTTEAAEKISADWLRVELVGRPQKAGRDLAASINPTEVWGMSRWSKSLLERLEGVSVPRVVMRGWRPADDVRAMDTLIRQYGPLLRRRAARMGGYQQLARYLEGRLEDEA